METQIKVMRAVAASVALFTAGAAAASDWYFLGTGTNSGKSVYVDADSVLGALSAKRAWVATIDANGVEVRMLLSFKCASREYAMVSYSEYRGGKVESRTAQVPDYIPVVPDSMGESWQAVACAQNPRLQLEKIEAERIAVRPAEHASAMRAAELEAMPEAEPPAADAPELAPSAAEADEKTYADCVLRRVRPGLSDMATAALVDACRKRHPVPLTASGVETSI